MKHRIDQLIEGCATKPKLLVVDDHPINIEVVYSIFKGQFNVIMATSGEKALEQVEKHRPDLIMLDVMMPGMDGYEVCRRLQANPTTCDTPVLFLTGHNDAAHHLQGLSIGAIDFISKPIDRVLVEARVRICMALKLQADLLKSMSMHADTGDKRDGVASPSSQGPGLGLTPPRT